MQRQNDRQDYQWVQRNRCLTPEEIKPEKKDLEACVLLDVLWKSLCLSLGHCMGKNVKELV